MLSVGNFINSIEISGSATGENIGLRGNQDSKYKNFVSSVVKSMRGITEHFENKFSRFL